MGPWHDQMVRCQRCQVLHKKCDGDGISNCSRCTKQGIKCKYVCKRKTGPRQGWVNKLKKAVQNLQNGAPLEAGVLAQIVKPISPSDISLCLQNFFLNSNSLIPIVSHANEEMFQRYVQTPTSSPEAAGARSALYNSVVSFSVLLMIPL